MLRRELEIVLRARVTWLAATAAALVVGHGFVLAIELYGAASRSALADVLMHRELDPLAGVVRPTLGGQALATALLVPVVAARGLAVEKERNGFGALAIASGSPWRVLARKLVAALVASSLLLVAPLVLLSLYAVLGRLDLVETSVAFLGHVLHVTVVAIAAVAAATWTRTVAQATTIWVLVSLASWVIEAGEGFAALAWLAPLEAASLSRQLAPFEHGIVALGALAWFGVALAAGSALAALGVWLDGTRTKRAVLGATVLVLSLAALDAATRIHRAYDWTESRRASLPPAAVAGLRSLDQPIAITVTMDREDSRRLQLERDTLAKLRLARPDVAITMPLDDRRSGEAPVRDDAYGRLVIQVGANVRETRSTSRREIVTLVFEAAGLPAPDWSQAAYPGYPVVLDGMRLGFARAMSYLVVPGGLFVVGMIAVGRGRRRTKR